MRKFYFSILFFFSIHFNLISQNSNTVEEKLFIIKGKISDTSLIKYEIYISLIRLGTDSIIESITIDKNRTTKSQYFTFKFPKSDLSNAYLLLFREKKDSFEPFIISLILYKEDSIFVDIKKKKESISVVFNDTTNTNINNIYSAIDSNFMKYSQENINTDSSKISFFKDLTKLIETIPEVGIPLLWKYKNVAFKDSVDYVFMNVLYEKIDSLNSIKFKHVMLDILNSEIKPNKKSMDFLSQSMDSLALNTTQYRGYYCLIDFWASWCGPCRRKNQELKKNYNKLSSKGLKILSVSIDDNYELWKRAVDEDELPWENGWLSDKNVKDSIMKFYRIDTIPTTILLDIEGKVIGINPSLSQIENVLNR